MDRELTATGTTSTSYPRDFSCCTNPISSPVTVGWRRRREIDWWERVCQIQQVHDCPATNLDSVGWCNQFCHSQTQEGLKTLVLVLLFFQEVNMNMIAMFLRTIRRRKKTTSFDPNFELIVVLYVTMVQVDTEKQRLDVKISERRSAGMPLLKSACLAIPLWFL